MSTAIVMSRWFMLGVHWGPRPQASAAPRITQVAARLLPPRDLFYCQVIKVRDHKVNPALRPWPWGLYLAPRAYPIFGQGHLHEQIPQRRGIEDTGIIQRGERRHA
jgi:hypothetical protein